MKLSFGVLLLFVLTLNQGCSKKNFTALNSCSNSDASSTDENCLSSASKVSDESDAELRAKRRNRTKNLNGDKKDNIQSQLTSNDRQPAITNKKEQPVSNPIQLQNNSDIYDLGTEKSPSFFTDEKLLEICKDVYRPGGVGAEIADSLPIEAIKDYGRGIHPGVKVVFADPIKVPKISATTGDVYGDGLNKPGGLIAEVKVYTCKENSIGKNFATWYESTNVTPPADAKKNFLHRNGWVKEDIQGIPAPLSQYEYETYYKSNGYYPFTGMFKGENIYIAGFPIGDIVQHPGLANNGLTDAMNLKINEFQTNRVLFKVSYFKRASNNGLALPAPWNPQSVVVKAVDMYKLYNVAKPN